MPGIAAPPTDVSVAQMVSSVGEWRWEILEPMLPLEILLRIAAIKCPASGFPADSIGWNGVTLGSFTLKLAYHIGNGVEEGPNENIWRIITHFKGLDERHRSTLEHAREWLKNVDTATSMGNLVMQRIPGPRYPSNEVILELDNLDVVSCIRREQQLIGSSLLGSYILELCSM
ncbi:hypothetical protein V6N12_033194 [Hibiscus sabdariffa]|uniref:Uncharacterized protein n=1 Tax=Hibiscus sabdariffa TaxID=183260 RepID=A0ABR2AT65_9ROSI